MATTTMETTTDFWNGSTSFPGIDDCAGSKALYYPEAGDFLHAIFVMNNVFAYVLSVACALYVLNGAFCIKLMVECWKIKDENIRGDIILCLALPFIISTTCLVSAIFPRAYSQMQIFGVVYMMFALWRALALIFRLYGDVAHMSSVMTKSGTRVKLNVIPLCCCCCLPYLQPKLKTMSVFKYLVLQTPLMRITILAAVDVIRTEGLCDWTHETKILNYFDSLSTFISLYASSVFVFASHQNLERYRIGYMMRGVTTTQTIYNLQRLLMERLSVNARILPDWKLILPDGELVVVEARVQADFWHNTIMILWMTLISILFLVFMRPKMSELFTMDKIPIAHVDVEGHFPHIRSVAPSVLTVNGGIASKKGSVNEGFEKDEHHISMQF